MTAERKIAGSVRRRRLGQVIGSLAFIALFSCTQAPAASERFVVMMAGTASGHLNVDATGNWVTVDYAYRQNGRGPTMIESLVLDREGIPTSWTITGTTTFGSKVHEVFTQTGRRAQWADSTGRGTADTEKRGLYIAQNASPWALGLYTRAALKRGGRSTVLPQGELRVDKGETFAVSGPEGSLEVTAYSLIGIDLEPSDILLDPDGNLFAQITPNFTVLRSGYEGEDARLRDFAASRAKSRYVAIEKTVAHRYDGPVRIRNVRVFDPKTSALSEPKSVVVSGRQIGAVESLDSPTTPGETIIDGAGGTLVPGMFEMHAHLEQRDALLNLAAGITTVRDMGNDNSVLDELIRNIDAGIVGGPHVVRSGFIEGKSPYNAIAGILVDSERAAIDAVRWYGARGYWQIKIYNSVDPAWVPAMAKEAHLLGMRVAGHIPAFTNADAMIEAGYDEITHMNQFMLGWVLQPGEDTRTLLRLLALARLPALDLDSAKVQHTIELMVAHRLAIDPTLVAQEDVLLNRDGQVPPGEADTLYRMPIAYQRNAKRALVDLSHPGDDKAYREAFEKILATLKMLNDRGVLIVPGTDAGGPFLYHHELELYQRVGMSPSHILKRATLDMAKYLGQDQRLGSIEKGKLADFFLVPGDPTDDIKAIKSISMVVKDGTVYFPAEIYPYFGIKALLAVPAITQPKN